MILHEMATTWAQANCVSVDVQNDLLRQLDRAVQRNVSCSFTIGDSLTKSRKPYLISCFGGEFFVFELTRSQVARLGMKDNELDCSPSARRETYGMFAEPHVWLQEVNVDHAAALNGEVPITGSLSYRAEQSVLQPLEIRVVCEPLGRDSVTLLHPLSQLAPPEGTVKFTLRKIADLLARGGKAYTGVVPLFFQIWTANQRAGQRLPGPALDMPSLGGHAMRPNVSRKPGMLTPGSPKAPLSSISLPPSDPPAVPDKPISDIRAVLVDVV